MEKSQNIGTKSAFTPKKNHPTRSQKSCTVTRYASQ